MPPRNRLCIGRSYLPTGHPPHCSDGPPARLGPTDEAPRNASEKGNAQTTLQGRSVALEPGFILPVQLLAAFLDLLNIKCFE